MRWWCRWRICCAGPSARPSTSRSSRLDDLWGTLCDPNQLESALLNLAINARDAMPDGGRLTIATANARLDSVAADTPALSPGEYICIAVTDTGVGMSAEVAARAFDPFFTTKPIGQGTGLGLSMIYGFARQSNGHVTIDSRIGQGTSVKLYLPRHHGDIDTEQASAVAGGRTCRDRRNRAGGRGRAGGARRHPGDAGRAGLPDAARRSMDRRA